VYKNIVTDADRIERMVDDTCQVYRFEKEADFSPFVTPTAYKKVGNIGGEPGGG
jgi:hypothetical protein